MSSGSGRDSNAGPLANHRMTTQEFGNTLSENHTTRPLEPIFGGTLEYIIKLKNSSTNPPEKRASYPILFCAGWTIYYIQ